MSPKGMARASTVAATLPALHLHRQGHDSRRFEGGNPVHLLCTVTRRAGPMVRMALAAVRVTSTRPGHTSNASPRSFCITDRVLCEGGRSAKRRRAAGPQYGHFFIRTL